MATILRVAQLTGQRDAVAALGDALLQTLITRHDLRPGLLSLLIHFEAVRPPVGAETEHLLPGIDNTAERAHVLGLEPFGLERGGRRVLVQRGRGEGELLELEAGVSAASMKGAMGWGR